MARRKGRRGDRSPRHEGTAEGRARAGARVRTLAAGAAALGVALAAPAEAATFNVTNLNNTGAGSLRQAIANANATAGADVITFQDGLTGTITLLSGQLGISDSVDIQGPGAAVLTVSGNNLGRVFYLDQPNALIDVTISGLTITGGIATSGPPSVIVFGGGIRDNGENLTLDQVVITGNRAVGSGAGDGGGLALLGNGSDLAQLVIRDSTISGNRTSGNFFDGGGNGGGIAVRSGGQVLIQRTAITGNNAYTSGGGAYFRNTGPVTIEDCTISDNVGLPVGAGGGLALSVTSQQLGPHTIRRSTISGNSAVSGGGLSASLSRNGVLVENSTISGNHATGEAGGAKIFETIATLRHTTIANNSAGREVGGVLTARGGSTVLDHVIAGDNAPGDLGSSETGFFDARFSLVEDPGTAVITDSGGNVFNQAPQLGPLTHNGGPTQTQRPASASPAVNAGDPAFAPPPASDQRGSARVAGGRIDMGAVEVNAGTVQLTTSAVAVAENALTVTITATRTGGAEGAVSASYATADGTAVAPADYGSAAGVLSWANQDSAPKSFQVTIVDDTLDEVDETFVATLTDPQGGAGLGASTQEVTILDDDEPIVLPPAEEIPTLGQWGLSLLAALLGGGALAFLRKRP